MFFSAGSITDVELASQLLAYARALGSEDATILERGGWHIVGSSRDWFLQARFQLPEDLQCSSLVPAPEWAPNTTRPEVLIGLLAKGLLVKKNGSVLVALPGTEPFSTIERLLVGQSAWKRAIAFTGAN